MSDACTCPHAVQGLGTLYGISVGKGRVRTSVSPGCPEHDSCQHYDGTPKPWGTQPYCPIHGAKGCPRAT